MLFMENKKYLILDLSIYILFLFLIMIFRADIGIIISAVLLLLFILFTKRYDLLKFLSIAFVMAFLWQIVGGREYYYGKDFIIISGINVFALFAWTIGLFVAYIIFFYAYSFVSGNTGKNANNLLKILLFIFFFWIALIVAETLAYHVFGFKNLGGIEYEGLPVCDCIHSPMWMQAVYLSFGPVYILVIYLVRKIKIGKNKENKNTSDYELFYR